MHLDRVNKQVVSKCLKQSAVIAESQVKSGREFHTVARQLKGSDSRQADLAIFDMWVTATLHTTYSRKNHYADPV